MYTSLWRLLRTTDVEADSPIKINFIGSKSVNKTQIHNTTSAQIHQHPSPNHKHPRKHPLTKKYIYQNSNKVIHKQIYQCIFVFISFYIQLILLKDFLRKIQRTRPWNHTSRQSAPAASGQLKVGSALGFMGTYLGNLLYILNLN